MCSTMFRSRPRVNRYLHKKCPYILLNELIIYLVVKTILLCDILSIFILIVSPVSVWLGAGVQYLQCVSNGDTAILHSAIQKAI